MHLMLRSFSLRMALAACALGLSGGAAGADETATVTSGFTDPGTLTFRQAAAPLIDGFNGAELDLCRWDPRADPSFSLAIAGGALVSSGTGTGNTLMYAEEDFEATTYTAGVTVSASSGGYHFTVATEDPDGGDGNPRTQLQATISQNSMGGTYLSVARMVDDVPAAQDSAQILPPGTPIPLPYTVSLVVNAAAQTAQATVTYSGGSFTRTIANTATYTRVRLRLGVLHPAGGSLSMDTITTDLQMSDRFTISNSPLSVFGTDYASVPDDGFPSGTIFLAPSGGAFITQDGACVALDGTQEVSAALVTFSFGLHSTVYTPLDETGLRAVLAGFDPDASVDCFGTGFASNGLHASYTFAPPTCPPLSSTTTTTTSSTTTTTTTSSTTTTTSTTTTSTTTSSTTTTTSSTTTTTTLPPVLPVCPAGPLSGCFEAGRGRLQVTDEGDDEHGRLDWSWERGDAFDVAALGNPTTASQYLICIYDGDAGSPVQSIALNLPAGERWTASRPNEFSYFDYAKDPSGVRSARLTAGQSGKGKLRVGAFGENLAVQLDPAGPGLFSSDPSVTVQLLRDYADGSAAACWSSEFIAVRKNTARRYKAVVQ